MKHCKNQLTMLITQYCCKTLSNCILEHYFPVPWPKSYRLWSKMVSVNEMRPDLCKFLVRSDVTTFASLVLWSFYEELSCPYSLQHYSGTTRTTEIPQCLWVYWQVCCDRQLSSKVKSVNDKSCFDQLAADSFSTSPQNCKSQFRLQLWK